MKKILTIIILSLFLIGCTFKAPDSKVEVEPLPSELDPELAELDNLEQLAVEELDFDIEELESIDF